MIRTGVIRYSDILPAPRFLRHLVELAERRQLSAQRTLFHRELRRSGGRRDCANMALAILDLEFSSAENLISGRCESEGARC